MEKRSQYTIQFASLSNGDHEYDFTITDAFFEQFENSLINKAEVKVKVQLHKGVHNLQFTFQFTGRIHVACVRCLDEFDMPVQEVRHLMVRQLDAVDEVAEEEEDIISMPLTAHEINLAPHIYDYLNLMVPLNPVHPDKEDGTSGCDEEVLKVMKNHLINDEEHNDPTWDILRKLKLK